MTSYRPKGRYNLLSCQGQGHYHYICEKKAKMLMVMLIA